MKYKYVTDDFYCLKVMYKYWPFWLDAGFVIFPITLKDNKVLCKRKNNGGVIWIDFEDACENVNPFKILYKNWFIHNTIGHTFMQLFNMVYLPKVGTWFHDVTLPKVDEK